MILVVYIPYPTVMSKVAVHDVRKTKTCDVRIKVVTKINMIILSIQ